MSPAGRAGPVTAGRIFAHGSYEKFQLFFRDEIRPNILATSSGAKCEKASKHGETQKSGLSAGTGKLCIFGHLGLVFIWSCFVSCLLLLLYYVICAPVLTEGTQKSNNFRAYHSFGSSYGCITAVKQDAYDVENTAGNAGRCNPGRQSSSRKLGRIAQNFSASLPRSR